MNPKDGKAGQAVAPAAPEAAADADVANPGEAAKLKAKQIEKKEGKYGSEQVKPHKPTEEDIEEKSWIEIELVDEEDNPVPGKITKLRCLMGLWTKGRWTKTVLPAWKGLIQAHARSLFRSWIRMPGKRRRGRSHHKIGCGE